MIEIHKNDNKSEFPDFNEFTLHMIFKNFHENSHYRNDHFLENHENYKWVEFAKIGEFSIVIIFEIFIQN